MMMSYCLIRRAPAEACDVSDQQGLGRGMRGREIARTMPKLAFAHGAGTVV